MGARDCPQEPGYLRRRQHHRECRRCPGAGNLREPTDVSAKNLAIQEEQRAVRLILGRLGDALLGGQMSEEPFDVDCRKSRWMAIARKPDVAFDPVDVCLLGPPAVMLEADAIPNLVEQAWRPGRQVDW